MDKSTNPQLVDSIEDFDDDWKPAPIGSDKDKAERRIQLKDFDNVVDKCKKSNHIINKKCIHKLCYNCHINAEYCGLLPSGCNSHTSILRSKAHMNNLTAMEKHICGMDK
jgi:hypothetical protein